MADVFTVLSEDHRQVEALLEEVRTASGQRQKELADRLVIAESKHEAVEEMYFWPVVRDRLTDGVHLADTAIGQESEGKQLLARIDKTGADDPELGPLLAAFAEAATAHVAYEEGQVWTQLQAAITPPEAAELGQRLADAKAAAPTRPHPHTPPTPGALKTAGTAAAMTDKVRDALHHRG